MSRYHENITWPTEGGWRCGFYAVDWQGTDENGEPDEWDVEWAAHFQWVSTLAPTPDAAMNQWNGCNPGSGTICAEGDPEIPELNALAEACEALMAQQCANERRLTRLSGRRW